MAKQTLNIKPPTQNLPSPSPPKKKKKKKKKKLEQDNRLAKTSRKTTWGGDPGSWGEA